MLANFLIGLREGLEASLIVGILIAFALKVDRRDLIGRIWTGVGAAVIVSLGTGALIFYVLAESGEAVEPIIVGSLSVLAAGLLTWMIFWMAKTARNLKGSLEGSMQAGLSQGGIAIAVVAFTAVVREGVETAVFIWASMNSTGDGLPAMGIEACSGLIWGPSFNGRVSFSSSSLRGFSPTASTNSKKLDCCPPALPCTTPPRGLAKKP